MARKNSLEKPKPGKKPGYEGWPVLFWLCWVEIITEHGQDVQIFINDQHGKIIIITVVIEGAASQHLRSKCQLAFHSRSIMYEHDKIQQLRHKLNRFHRHVTNRNGIMCP